MAAVTDDLHMARYSTLAKPKLFSAVKKICALLARHGGAPYFVGGCVRDALLGTKISDFDIEVFGLNFAALLSMLESEFDCIVQNYELKSGEHFGVIKIPKFCIDVSVPRAEVRIGPKHTDFRTWQLDSCTVAEAASRRDFTINSIYFDVLNEKIHDPYGGIADLEGKVLRNVGDKFAEDPLRVLRGMQFAARFDLSASESTVALAGKLTSDGLSAERVFCEWRKFMLLGKKPSSGLRFLRECKWTRFFPEIEALIHCPQDPYRHPEGSAFEHTCLALDLYAANRSGVRNDDVAVGFAVLCHDFGKPLTTVADKSRIHHRGHDIAGLPLVRSFLESMRAPKWLVRDVEVLVKYHMVPRDIFTQQDGRGMAVLRLANSVGRLDRLIRVCKCDANGRSGCWGPMQYEPEEVLWLQRAATELGVVESKPKPIVAGGDLLARGLQPSPKFSEILNECFEAQLDMKFTDRGGGLKFLDSILRLT
jgi:tRNA nucleotidyltransferase (CCA-adding enzyme)